MQPRLVIISSLALAALVAGCAKTQPPPRPPAAETAPTTPPAAIAAPARAGPNLVYVTDQPPGVAVTVAQVGLARSGYVVIHNSDNGKPGEVVGASSLLSAGDRAIVSVTLTQPAGVGQVLFAMLHRDDGDGAFDAANDLPVRDSLGNTMMMEFSISADVNAPDAVQF